MYTPTNRSGFFADAKRSLALQALDKKRATQSYPPIRTAPFVDTTIVSTANNNHDAFDAAYEALNGKSESPVPEKYHRMAQGLRDDQERQRIKFQDKRITEKVSHGIRTRHDKNDPFVKHSDPNAD